MKKLALSILMSITLCVTLFFYSCGIIFFTNPQEYTIPFNSFFPLLTRWGGYVAGVLTLILFIIPRKWDAFPRAIATVAILSLMAYIYCSIIVWNYDLLDGSDFEWSEYRYRTIVDIVFIGACAFILWRYWRNIYKLTFRICFALIIVQIATLYYYNAIKPTAIHVGERKFVDREFNFDYSANDSIIYILVDTFVAHALNDLLENQEYRDYFNAFTNFTDCACGYRGTTVSVGLMLTGQYYDNSQTILEYYDSAMAHPESLPGFLKQKGYTINIFSSVANVYNDAFAKHVDNVVGSPTIDVKEGLTLLNAAIFRCVPHFIKPLFIHKENLLFHLDKDLSGIWDYKFLADMQNAKFTKLRSKPNFTFYHLWGYHPPHFIDENFNYRKEGVSGFTQAKAVARLLNLFFEKLKQIDVFDNSTIIIAADHGDNCRFLECHIALMIKPKGAADAPLKMEDTPVSLADVPSLVQNIVADPKNWLASFKPRPQRFFHEYGMWDVGWSFTSHMPVMDRYEITGHASDIDSLKLVGKLFPNSRRIPHNQKITFDFVNDIEDFQDLLISNPFEYVENFGLKPLRKISSFSVGFDEGTTPSHFVKITVQAEPSDNEPPRLTLFGNVLATGESFTRSWDSLTAVLPAVSDMWVNVQNVNYISSVSFEPQDSNIPIQLNQEYVFNSHDPYFAFALTGTNGFDGWGVWTKGETALSIPWTAPPTEPVNMTIKGMVFATPNWPTQRMYVLVNDKIIASKEFTYTGTKNSIITDAEWTFTLDPAWFSNQSRWDLRIECPDHKSPAEVGYNEDTRQLGLRIRSIYFANSNE